MSDEISLEVKQYFDKATPLLLKLEYIESNGDDYRFTRKFLHDYRRAMGFTKDDTGRALRFLFTGMRENESMLYMAKELINDTERQLGKRLP